jgi:hypothetical protein
MSRNKTVRQRGEGQPSLEKLVRRATGGETVTRGERIQSLWSGYGEIVRMEVTGGSAATVIVKSVEPPSQAHHPRGWSTDRSHQRKLRSYAVEHHFYASVASRCTERCRVPRALGCHAQAGRWVFVLEDLDASGFAGRRPAPDEAEVLACLLWLAEFHALFIGQSSKGLWPVGTYWHLGTRPDELAIMRNAPLRAAASALDARLSSCTYRTLVHGDAKVQNFCFAEPGGDQDQPRVAAVDFQYVGGGPGVKDVAYFISSIWDSEQCEAQADWALARYLEALENALGRCAPEIDAVAVVAEWRPLYSVCWADFSRFLNGWAPGHTKLHPYARRMTDAGLRAVGAFGVE